MNTHWRWSDVALPETDPILEELYAEKAEFNARFPTLDMMVAEIKRFSKEQSGQAPDQQHAPSDPPTTETHSDQGD